MFINDYMAMQLHKVREMELNPPTTNNRALAEIIAEFKEERSRRSRKLHRNS